MERIVEKTERMSLNDRVSLEKQMTIPMRPGTGTTGKGIRLYANYFQVTGLPVGEIIQYDVVITPEVPRNLKR